MSKIVWDQVGERFYETGVSKGVLYPAENGTYPKGVAWNGLTSVSENRSGAEPTALYADNIKYLNLMSTEEYGATIEAYTYPKEFAECDGSKALTAGVMVGQQPRKQFGFSYQTRIGNDTDGTEHGYKIHLVYGCLASPSEMQYGTINDSPEAATMSWEISTTPVDVEGEGFKSTATLTISSLDVDADKLKKLEDALYGTAEKEAYLPLPKEVAEIFSAA